MPALHLRTEGAFFRQRESRKFRDLEGFDKKRGHTVPDRHSGSAASWASRLLSDEILAESKAVYDNCKSVLGFKRAKIERTTGVGTAGVETALFKMLWDTGQDRAAAGHALITRTLQLRVPPEQLPTNFDATFPIDPDELVIPLEGDFDFDTVADTFEALEERLPGARFTEDQDVGRAALALPDGTTLTVLVADGELVVTMAGKGGALALLRQSAATLDLLAQVTARASGAHDDYDDPP